MPTTSTRRLAELLGTGSTVDATDIADGSVTAAKMASGAVTELSPGLAKNIAGGTISSPQFLFGDTFTLTGNLTVNNDLLLGKLSELTGSGITLTGDGTTITGAGKIIMGCYLEGGEQARKHVNSITGTSGSLDSNVVYLKSPNTPINAGTLQASTRPRFAIGDGWLSGGDVALTGTNYYGYQEVTSGSGIVIGTVAYASGAADSYLVGMLEVIYGASVDASRSGFYRFRIGYTGNTTTTQLEGSAQNSSLTCTKTNDGVTQSIVLTPTTTTNQTVKVWYRFMGFPVKPV